MCIRDRHQAKPCKFWCFCCNNRIQLNRYFYNRHCVFALRLSFSIWAWKRTVFVGTMYKIRQIQNYNFKIHVAFCTVSCCVDIIHFLQFYHKHFPVWQYRFKRKYSINFRVSQLYPYSYSRSIFDFVCICKNNGDFCYFIVFGSCIYYLFKFCNDVSYRARNNWCRVFALYPVSYTHLTLPTILRV